MVAEEVGSVVGFVEAEGAAEFSGSAAEGCCGGVWGVKALAHGVDADDGFEGADEAGLGFVEGAADGVDAPVHSVDKIDVGVAFGAEHGFGAGCASAAAGVGAEVVGAAVGFGFDDSSAGDDAVMAGEEELADDVVADFEGGAVEEVAGEAVIEIVGGEGRDPFAATYFGCFVQLVLRGFD